MKEGKGYSILGKKGSISAFGIKTDRVVNMTDIVVVPINHHMLSLQRYLKKNPSSFKLIYCSVVW